MDRNALRSTFGRFATGVTIVSCESGGDVHGMTANSFTSVSLDPALVLVSLGNRTRMAEMLRDGGDFGLNILSAAQQGLSNHFAGRPGEDRIVFTPIMGVPMIAGALAHLVCRLRDVWPAGDHSLFVGEVLHHAQDDAGAAPLLFYGGAYRHLDQAFA
ncbi:flavin reductase family protein [Novosphingobium rosa]|uniref:flavin reductase family protein n=1 Tax=Novosphingobium rosa TaxID=76978 RepID=UPI0008359D88|nr:flavin reductase family protein [Novosphingobium rosa]